MVMDMESLTKQLRSIKKEDLDDDARTKLLLATQSLAQRLESPLEWVQRMAFENVS